MLNVKISSYPPDPTRTNMGVEAKNLTTVVTDAGESTQCEWMYVDENGQDASGFGYTKTVIDPAEGRVASSGAGRKATGPTASIATSNLRRDSLTTGAFFI